MGKLIILLGLSFLICKLGIRIQLFPHSAHTYVHPQVPGTVLNPGVTVVIKTDPVAFLLNLPVL